MLAKLKNYVIVVLVFALIAAGVTMWWKSRNHADRLVDLHNRIAEQSQTIEIHKNVYAKKSAELDDLDSLLKSLQGDKARDAETIAELRRTIKERGDEMLSVSRLAAKWKKAYEAEVSGKQSDVPSETAPGQIRKRVDFEADFGYISAEGFTLTDPPFASLKIEQARALILSVVISQDKEGSWNTAVVSSEDEVEVDVVISAINPYMSDRKWYEKVGVGMSLDMSGVRLEPRATVTYPVGPMEIAAGVLLNLEESKVDWVGVLRYRWEPFGR